MTTSAKTTRPLLGEVRRTQFEEAVGGTGEPPLPHRAHGGSGGGKKGADTVEPRPPVTGSDPE